MGRGLAALADTGAREVSDAVRQKVWSVEEGSTVTEAQMKALFGLGLHPNADKISEHVSGVWAFNLQSQPPSWAASSPSVTKVQSSCVARQKRSASTTPKAARQLSKEIIAVLSMAFSASTKYRHTISSSAKSIDFIRSARRSLTQASWFLFHARSSSELYEFG